jgi:hypothetical protein
MPESIGVTALKRKLDMTGPDVAGIMGVLVITTLPSFTAKVCSPSAQEMEVRGRLKPEIDTDRFKSSLAVTSIVITWSVVSLTTGGTKAQKELYHVW